MTPCRIASRRAPRRAFTIVELMIVIVVIGILCTMALNSIARVRREARAMRFVNDLRVVRDTIENYAMESGYYPEDVASVWSGDFADPRLARKWDEATPIGGAWDWSFDVEGVAAALSAIGTIDDEALLLSIDRKIDNGDLGSGVFRSRGGGVMYVIAE